MCGIVADWCPAGVCPERLRRALAAIRHRGPDGEGTWLAPGGQVALGHVRLAVLDPQGSPQPIPSEDGRVVVAVNGEFYGHDDIRRELARRGHRFRTGGDSEIAVHLYEEYGVDFVHHLRGEFALVLWDDRQRLLLAARDRFGIKPLCYHHEAGRLRLASEAKALFALGVRPTWDEEAFFRVAGMQYLPPDRTLFAGVCQLRPGHLLIAQRGEVRTVPYWDMDHLPEAEKSAAPPEELARELRHGLEEAVRLRLRADVPVCCHLSGGLDSSAVAALVARHQRPACFTVGFEATGYDELALGRHTAEYLGAAWHPLPLRQAELTEHLADAVWFSEGLAINGHLPAKFLLARAIRAAGFKVVLSGEGADEVLAGYAHLREDLARCRGADPVAANPILAGIHLPQGEALPLSAVERSLGFVPTFLHAKATLGWRLHTLLRDDFHERCRDRDPYAEFLQAFDAAGQLAGRHPVDQASYLWSKAALAGYILRTLGDGTEMAHAVEGRLPFLDHHLFALVRPFPIDVKLRGDVEKWVLRRAMADLLPGEVLHRAKLPFTAPPLSLFTGPGATLLEDTLRSPRLADVPFFDPARVRGLLDRLPALAGPERVAWDPVLMLVLTACLAQERFAL